MSPWMTWLFLVLLGTVVVWVFVRFDRRMDEFSMARRRERALDALARMSGGERDE